MSFADAMNTAVEGPSFGLDFGTYRSMAAVCDSGTLIVPSYSDACQGGVPSLFWRTADGKEWVGDEVYAHNGCAVDPLGVCSSIKTRLKEPEIELHGKKYTPREIAVRIIRRMSEVTKPLLEQEFIDADFSSIVCGVPVRFNAAERNEIRGIVYEALGGAEVQLVPEPILAALAVDYYLYQKNHKVPDRPVLVFDMGAGTFDVALLKTNPWPTQAEPYPYIALDPQGSRIAGDAMDARMEQLMLEKLGKPEQWPTMNNPQHQDRETLKFTARKAKECLSMKGCTEIDELIADSRGSRATLHITRAEYEQRIQPDVKKNVDMAAQIVRKNGFWGDPALDIVLVGGSTYLPLVRQQLLQTFDWLSESDIQQRLPEKAVALGAAVFAAHPQLLLPPVAYGYGVSTYNAKQQKDMIHVCIPSNAKLPMSQKFTFATRYDNQEGVRFLVYEVDHGETGTFLEMNEGRQLMQSQTAYSVYHSFGRSVPEHTLVELTVTLDINGLLILTVSDLGVSGQNTVKTVDLHSAVR